MGLLLSSGGLTLAVAESCTGGLIGYRLTSLSGSSAYFVGGVIAYANAVKVRELGVDAASIGREGAVSEGVARQMAQGVRERFHANLGLAVTGIAGPNGGSPDKPVGLVYVGLASDGEDTVKRFVFPGDREAVRDAAADAALNLVMQYLDGKGEGHGKESKS